MTRSATLHNTHCATLLPSANNTQRSFRRQCALSGHQHAAKSKVGRLHDSSRYRCWRSVAPDRSSATSCGRDYRHCASGRCYTWRQSEPVDEDRVHSIVAHRHDDPRACSILHQSRIWSEGETGGISPDLHRGGNIPNGRYGVAEMRTTRRSAAPFQGWIRTQRRNAPHYVR